jgi:hypothetical protein
MNGLFMWECKKKIRIKHNDSLYRQNKLVCKQSKRGHNNVLNNDIFLRVKVLQNYDLNLIVAILKGTGPKKKKKTN